MIMSNAQPSDKSRLDQLAGGKDMIARDLFVPEEKRWDRDRLMNMFGSRDA